MTYYWQEYNREDTQPMRYIQVLDRRPPPPPPTVRRATLSRVEYYPAITQPQHNYYQECPEQNARTARIIRSNTMKLIKPVAGVVETIRVPIQIKQQITVTPVIQAGNRTFSTAKINLIESIPIPVNKASDCKPAYIHARPITKLSRSSTSANLAEKSERSLIRLAEPIKIVNYRTIPISTSVAIPAKACFYQNPANCASNYNLPEPCIEYRNIDQTDNDLQTYIRDNNNFRQFNKTIVTTVNRNHLHTHRIVTNENNYDTYVTNNIIRVNDIHHNRIEHVPGEKRTFVEYKNTQIVEPPTCENAKDECSSSNSVTEEPSNNPLAEDTNSAKETNYTPDENFSETPYHSSINL